MCRHSYATIFTLHSHGLVSSENFEKIPSRHFLSRWTRDAKKGLLDFPPVDTCQSDNIRKLCASFRILVSHACQDPMKFQQFLDHYNEFYYNHKPISNDDSEVVPGMFYCSSFIVISFIFIIFYLI